MTFSRFFKFATSHFSTLATKPLTKYLLYGGMFGVSSSNIPSAGDRLYNLLDFYDDKPAGLWHQLYYTRIFLKDTFEKGIHTKEGQQFTRNWIKIKSYICGMDGLSDIEKEAIVIENNSWNPKASKEELNKLCEEAIKFNDKELIKACHVIRKSYTKQQINALLLNALFTAAVDGLDITEMNGFFKVAEILNVSKYDIHTIYSLYMQERDLRQKYDQFLMA